MKVLAYDPVSEPPADVRCADLQDLVSRSDVITLHLPLLESTHHLVGSELLRHVKPGAILVNCGRGGLIDLDAVHAALQDGRLGGVGLDVFDPEPPEHHPLFDHPDVVLTPHLMGMSRQAQRGHLHRRRAGRPRCAHRRTARPRWPTPAGNRRHT